MVVVVWLCGDTFLFLPLSSRQIIVAFVLVQL